MIKDNVSNVVKSIENLAKSKFFKVFFWDLLSKGTDYALLPIFLKVLSQEEYGFYTYILYVITTISGIIKLGLDTAISKMYYEENNYERGTMLFSTNMIWVSFFLLILIVGKMTGWDILFFTEIVNITAFDYSQIRYFIFAFIFFNLLQTTLNVFFVIDDNIFLYQKYNLIKTIGGNIIVILLLLFIAKGNKAFFRLYLEPILFLISFIPLIIVWFKKMTLRIDFEVIRNSLSIGLPMVGTLIVGVVYNLSDKYYLQKVSGFQTLAVYNLAIFLTLPISLVFMSFNTVWLPQFFQEKSAPQNLQKTNRFFLILVVFYFFLMLLILVTLFISLKVNMLNHSYSNILYIYPFIFVSKVSDTLLQLYNNFIVSWGKTMFNFVASLFFGILTFSLNYKLIPIMGINGAILILLFISFVRLLTFYLFVKHHSRYEYNSKG